MKRFKILQGHALQVLKTLKSESINCCVSSPPYYGLRNYETESQVWDGNPNCKHNWETQLVKIGHENRNGLGSNSLSNKKLKGIHGQLIADNSFCSKCGAWKGSLGLEPNPDLFIKHLCDIFDEVKRVLRKDGTCWVVIGDSYGGSNCGAGQTKDSSGFQNVVRQKYYPTSKGKPVTSKILPKSLIGIPFRFAIEMIKRGWLLRNTIIWHKRNCIPSSARDRFTVDFEYIFFFTKSKKYFFMQQFEPLQESTLLRASHNATSKKTDAAIHGGMNLKAQKKAFKKMLSPDYPGRNRRCVWTVNTQPFHGAHFACFPPKLIEPMIKAGCPKAVCKKCGKPALPVFESTGKYITQGGHGSKTAEHIKAGKTSSLRSKRVKEKTFAGYQYCKCDAGFKPGIVLDPFAGAGTTAIVALQLGMQAIMIELNLEYCKMMNSRIKDELSKSHKQKRIRINE